MTWTDYYQVLDVSPAASQREIEQAYRRLARRYHPDLNPSPDAHDRMAAINQAYHVLRDPERRARYDASARFWQELQQQAPLQAAGPFPHLRPPEAFVRQQTAWLQAAHALPETLLTRASQAYRAFGYRILQVLPRGPHITDLLLFRRGQHALARLHVAPLVTEPDIRALLDELRTARQVNGACVTTGFFSAAARRLAETHRLPLYDGPTFDGIYRRVTAAEPST